MVILLCRRFFNLVHVNILVLHAKLRKKMYQLHTNHRVNCMFKGNLDIHFIYLKKKGVIFYQEICPVGGDCHFCECSHLMCENQKQNQYEIN